MGSTFSAIHVWQGQADELARELEERLTADREYERVADEAGASETDRLVLVFDDGHGWCVVADADHEFDSDAAAEVARSLSRSHRTTALLISVHHSDTALLARFSKGKARGKLRVPEDGRVDRKTGHRHVDASFLKDLATSDDARRALAAPILADRTFPEATILEVARLVGLHAPGAGARYLWNDPPPGAIRLRFTPTKAEPATEIDWRPPGEEDARLVLRHQPSAEGCVGGPLTELLHFELQSYEPQRVEGLRVELAGEGVALLGATGVRGWNAPAAASRVPLVTAAPNVLRASFPQGFVENARPLTMSAMTPAAFREWKQALTAHHEKQFRFQVDGTFVSAGTAPLEVRVTRLDGAPLPVSGGQMTLTIRQAPREPVLPADAPSRDPSRTKTLEAYADTSFVAGWLAFDAPWSALGDFVVDLGSRIAALAATPNPLELTLTSAGTHPTVKARFGPQAHLARDAFAVARATLAQEAQLRLHQPYDLQVERAAPQGEVLIAHEPRGNTVFDEATRRHFDALRPSPRIPPFSISFCLPAALATQHLAELVAVFREAVARASCVGALLTPAPRWHLDGLPWEGLTGTERFSSDVELARNHARAPGWFVLAAGASASLVRPSAGVTVQAVASGAVLQSNSPGPAAMSAVDREVMERAVLPALATFTRIRERFDLPA